MTISRHCRKVLLTIVVLGCLAGISAGAESIYDRFGTETLAKSLLRLKMNELLEGLSEKTGDKSLLISALLSEAELEPDPEKRDKLFEQAAELLRQSIKNLEDTLDTTTSDDAIEELLVKYYNLRMKQIDVAVVFRGKVYFDRILLLLGGDADRQELHNVSQLGVSQLKSLEAPIKPSEGVARYEQDLKDFEDEYKKAKDEKERTSLASDIARTKSQLAAAQEQLKWGSRSLSEDISTYLRKNPRFKVYLIPELEGIQNRLSYKSAFLNFYEALSQPMVITVTDEKTKKPAQTINNIRMECLRRAITDITPYAQKEELGVIPYARLLLGRCQRELAATQTALPPKDKEEKKLYKVNIENFEKAIDEFKWVTGPKAPKELLLEGLFELARTRIEYGAALLREGDVSAGDKQMATAKKAIDVFVEKAGEMTNPLAVDVKKLVLDYYLNEQWASALRTIKQPDKAAEHDKLVQRAFLIFVEKYPNPAIQAQVGELFAKKFRGNDTENLDPVIIMLLAKMEALQADRMQQGREFDQIDAQAQKTVTEHRHKAMDMLEKIRKSDSDSAKTALPAILFDLGVLYVKQGHEPQSNFKAAEAFRELVKKFPTSEYAKIAALNAVKITSQLIEIAQAENQPDLSQRRKEYIESLEILLKNWGNEEDVSPFYFDLAWQSDQMYRETEDEKWLIMAIDNYKKVPQSSPQYEAAQGYGLENEVVLLESQPESSQKSTAGKLVGDLLNYANAMHAEMLKADDKTRKQDLRDLGATAEFNAYRIEDKVLNQAQQAQQGLAVLPTRWPGSPVLRNAQEFAIRSFVERGEVDQAISALESFEKNYDTRQAEGLVQMVVQKIRQTIGKLLAENKTQQVAKFREAYLKFAGKIYSEKSKSPDVDQRYNVMSLYADALAQSEVPENASKALGVYAEMKTIEASRQAQQQKRINSYIDAKLAAFKGVENDRKKLVDEGAEINQALAEFNLKNWQNSKVISARDALKTLTEKTKLKDKVEIQKEAEFNLKRAQRFVGEAFEAIRQQALRQGTSIDAAMMAGMGHCYLVLKDYDQAITTLRTLLSGLTPQIDHGMYWQAQLDLCDALLDSAKNAEDYKRIVLYIDQLRGENAQLGGQRFMGRFNAIDKAAGEKAQ